MRASGAKVVFVGPHNSGKTRFVQRLTQIATDDGMRVGVIKRAARPLQLDASGKDSYLFARAGAARVVTSGPGVLFMQESEQEYPGAKTLMRRFGAGMDLWFMESYVPEPLAWVRIARPGQTAPAPDRFCVATIGDRVKGYDRPHFRLDRPRSVLKFILELQP